VPLQDFERPGTAVEQEIKCGQIGEELSPQLGIDRSFISEEAQFNAVGVKKSWVQIFFSLILGQKR